MTLRRRFTPTKRHAILRKKELSNSLRYKQSMLFIKLKASWSNWIRSWLKDRCCEKARQPQGSFRITTTYSRLIWSDAIEKPWVISAVRRIRATNRHKIGTLKARWTKLRTRHKSSKTSNKKINSRKQNQTVAAISKPIWLRRIANRYSQSTQVASRLPLLKLTTSQMCQIHMVLEPIKACNRWDETLTVAP